LMSGAFMTKSSGGHYSITVYFDRYGNHTVLPHPTGGGIVRRGV
jgi:hypothetical protein